MTTSQVTLLPLNVVAAHRMDVNRLPNTSTLIFPESCTSELWYGTSGSYFALFSSHNHMSLGPILVRWPGAGGNDWRR